MGFELNLYVDIQARKLVSGLTNATPVSLDGFTKEDSVDVSVQLLNPTGNISSPYDLVDISNLTMKMALGERDGTANALQDTWTKDTSAGVMKFSGNLVINTTEINLLLASVEKVDQFFEIEIQNSGKIWTVASQVVSITADVIRNSQIDPENVEAPSELATSMSDILTDGVTTEWSKSGDDITAHIKGLSGLADLSGDSSKVLSVKSTEDGFELTTPSTSATDLSSLTDTDLISATPDDGDHLEFDSGDSKWKPSSDPPAHAHAIDDLSDVTATSPTDGQIIKYDNSTSKFILSTEGAEQDIYVTIEGDSGATTATSSTSSVKLSGGEGIDTSVGTDLVVISAETATDTNSGIAKFNATNFNVDSGGDVTLKNVPISSGGTSSSNKEDAFDSLSPLSTQGDLLTHDGNDNLRLPIGTTDQILVVSSGGNVEWQTGGSVSEIEDLSDVNFSTYTPAAGDHLTWVTDSGGYWGASPGWNAPVNGLDAFGSISVAGQSSVIADGPQDGLTFVEGSNIEITTDAGLDKVTFSATNTDTLVGLTDTPASLGTSGQILKVNSGATATEWADESGGSGSPAGSDTQIQFNDSSSFGASSDLAWNGNHIETKGIQHKQFVPTDADTVDLDFDNGTFQDLASNRDASSNTLTFTTSNRGFGKTIMLHIHNGGSYPTDVTVPSGWVTVSDANSFIFYPAIPSGKYMIIRLTCWGSADSSIRAEYLSLDLSS